ncbi:MAG: acetylxylan esterase [Pirellulales bacterium]|nr:acetylxylan esterase [Pirellulales bacterium]
MNRMIGGIGILLFSNILILSSWARGPENWKVLPAQIDGLEPRAMMQHYLAMRTGAAFQQWRKTYESLKTPADIAAYQQERRVQFLKQIGGLPERTPLNARVTGSLPAAGYRIEKILYESRPKHYVSGNLYLPDETKFPRPVPGVVVVCGHSASGKAADPYARVSILCALNGLAALIIDPIEQGERFQWLDDAGKARIQGGTYGHTIIGISAALLGQNTARFEIWDAMRGIDYLQSRPEIDSARIGMTGCSGGGTQTAYTMALDDRIDVAVPSCYLTNFERLLATIGPQDAEQNIFGQIGWGMDHADYVLMRAPRPTLIAANTQDFFDIGGTWETFRYAKRLYTRLGASHHIDLVEIDDKHGYHKPAREAAVRFLAQWLGQSSNLEPVTEPDDLNVASEKDLWASPEGQVMRLPDARSVYDFMTDDLSQLAAARPELTPDLVRQTAGFPALSKQPALDSQEVGRIPWNHGSTIIQLILRHRSEPADHGKPGILLPALLFVPKVPSNGSEPAGPNSTSCRGVLYVHEQGKDQDAGLNGPIDALVRNGTMVLAVDLRGIGETFNPDQKFYHDDFGQAGKEYVTAYLLGESYVGMRATDLLLAARWLRDHPGTTGEPIDLVAVGHVGVPALHAAVAEPGLFGQIRIERTLDSWASLIQQRAHKRQLVNLVHGALRAYDLTDLRAAIGDRLVVVEPLDALGNAIE